MTLTTILPRILLALAIAGAAIWQTACCLARSGGRSSTLLAPGEAKAMVWKFTIAMEPKPWNVDTLFQRQAVRGWRTK